MDPVAQLIAHGFGDYGIQSHWMANEKTKHWYAALAHALTYGACFLVLGASWQALIVIVTTHYLIDRYRLAKYVAWAKNQLGPMEFRPGREAYGEGKTGYADSVPAWLSVWLMIALDNTIHVAINWWAVSRWP